MPQAYLGVTVAPVGVYIVSPEVGELLVAESHLQAFDAGVHMRHEANVGGVVAQAVDVLAAVNIDEFIRPVLPAVDIESFIASYLSDKQAIL